MNKYILTDETMEVDGRTLYRVKALKDFGDVKAGDLGGFVEKYENLSQIGNCWVFRNARVWGDAEVFGNARVGGNAKVRGEAEVFGNAVVRGNANVYDCAKVWGYAEVGDNAEVYGNARVWGDAEVFGKAKVYGDAEVGDNIDVLGDAEVSSMEDYIVFKNWWSSGRYFTWTRSNNMWRVGCFFGSGAELIEKAYKDSETSGHEYERVVKYVESILTEERCDI